MNKQSTAKNGWASELSESRMTGGRFANNKEAVSRRESAIALIKKACPGKAF